MAEVRPEGCGGLDEELRLLQVWYMEDTGEFEQRCHREWFGVEHEGKQGVDEQRVTAVQVKNCGLAKKFVQVLMEKPELVFWPTQYYSDRLWFNIALCQLHIKYFKYYVISLIWGI